ncbi:MAG: DUF3307 domain-containing protein [Syntrophotaleaceae bacterium]
MGADTLDVTVCLIAGHLLGDFLLQSDRMVRDKRTAGFFTLHLLTVTGITYLVCGLWFNWRIAVGVLLTHLVLDGLKTLSGKDGPAVFLADQGLHLASLAIIGGFWIYPAEVPFWQTLLPFYVRGVLLLAGGILCVRVGTFWVGKAVAPFQSAVGINSQGLPNAGRLIGQLERALIFLFVLMGETQGVGFLVAAKSILRIGEVRAPEQRKEAEYIIIGTLMSFGWALLVAYATKILFDRL